MHGHKLMNNDNSLQNLITNFNEAFSNQRLDEVMSYFADECEFNDFTGRSIRGKRRIRKIFALGFDGALGRMVFHEKSMMVDEKNREVSFMWTCEHLLDGSASPAGIAKVSHVFLRLILGKKFSWDGIDHFKFDENYKIVSKKTYGKFFLPTVKRG